jgi:hypothetical protein
MKSCFMLRRRMALRVVLGTVLAVVGGALLMLGLTGNQARCAAAEQSDSLAAASLRLAIGGSPWARISSPWSTARIIRPRVTATGLEFSTARPDEPGSDIGALPNPIPFAKVYRVEVPVSSSGSGLVFGAVVGATVGALTALAVATMPQVFPSREPESNHAGDIVLGAALGAAPGALLGALIGSAFRDTKEVYRRDRGR